MRGSNASQKMSVAKCNRRHYRLEKKNVDEKMLLCEKSRKSSSSAAVVAAENRAAGLTARQCDVGLTSTWFKAALLDVNGSPDLPDISMDMTVTAVFFICIVNIVEHLYLKRCVARVSA